MIAALTKISGHAPITVWQTETEIPDVDLIVIPGGFSYGDYLRCGAIAARMPVMQAIKEEGLVERAAEMGAYFVARLRELAKTHPVITEVRGRGLMVAIELGVPSEPVVAACLARGLLVNNVQPKAIRFVPPLIVERTDIDEAIVILGSALSAVGAEAGKAAAGPAASR